MKRFESHLSEHTTNGYKFEQQDHRRVQIATGIVETHLDDDRSRSIVDPLPLVQLRQVALHFRETTAKFVDVTTTGIRSVVAYGRGRVQRTARLVLKCSMDRGAVQRTR